MARKLTFIVATIFLVATMIFLYRSRDRTLTVIVKNNDSKAVSLTVGASTEGGLSEERSLIVSPDGQSESVTFILSGELPDELHLKVKGQNPIMFKKEKYRQYLLRNVLKVAYNGSFTLG